MFYYVVVKINNLRVILLFPVGICSFPLTLVDSSLQIEDININLSMTTLRAKEMMKHCDYPYRYHRMCVPICILKIRFKYYQVKENRYSNIIHYSLTLALPSKP